MLSSLDLSHEISTGGHAAPVSCKPGDTYGKLTVVELESTNHFGHRWRLLCTCGKTILRRTVALNQKAREGIVQACFVCKQAELVHARIARGHFWAYMFRKYGHVWPQSSEDRLVRLIVDDLEEAGHSPPHLALRERVYERMPIAETQYHPKRDETYQQGR